MSPKTRLSVLIVLLVATMVVVLSTFYLGGLTEAKFEDTVEVARITGEQVKIYMLERIAGYSADPPPATLEASIEMWRQSVSVDQQLGNFLIAAVASATSVAEIAITDSGGVEVAGSNPSRLDQVVTPAPELSEWAGQSAWQKLAQVLTSSEDLELRVPLGVAGETEPVFTIRVILSTVLLRNAVVPQVRNLAVISLLCVVVATVVAGLLANLAARPLERVSEMIDNIAMGKGIPDSSTATHDREMASLQSKLSLLGEQIRGAAGDTAQPRGSVEQMLENLEDAVLLFDRDDKLVIAGRAAERFLNQSRWDMLGRRLDELFPSSNPLGALVQSSARLRRTLRNHMLRWESNDLPERRVLVSLEMMEDFPAKQRLGTIVTLRDPESRRQLETRLDDSYRREAMGRILRGVAHEIKNPLNSIHTHAQMLELELGDSDDTLKEEVAIICREIRTLDRMVVTLLDFTKPLELNLAEVDLVALGREIAQLVGPDAAKKGARLEVAAGQESVDIRADHALLRQAVMNIVVNGVEALPGAGTVRISVTGEDGEGVLAVSDDGPGIPAEIRDRIFQLYFTTKGRGSGIGLAMSYRVAQLHGAALEMDTEEGKGTEFRFRFPIANS